MKEIWFDWIGYKFFISLHMPNERSLPGNAKLKRLLVDVSVLVQEDFGTGIQRVVRSVAFELNNIKGLYSIKIEFIYRHRARYYICHIDENHEFSRTDFEIFPEAGDLFLGLDFALTSIWEARNELAALKRQGVRFWFLIHDMLPLSNPNWFSRRTARRFRIWFAVIAGLAEGFFCVSEVSRQALHAALRERFQIDRNYSSFVIPMGWDLSSSCRSLGVPENFDALLGAFSSEPSILMVGTIEPRKGHEAAIEAMEVLWERGRAINLVLAGSPGWHTKRLQRAVKEHPLAGIRLFWLRQVSDEALSKLYQACVGLLMASRAEGFGLPLVEAIGHGKPVLARALPVFEVHGGKGVTFFPESSDAGQLAAAIERWVAETPATPHNYADQLPSWQDTARFIGQILSMERV